MKFILSLVKMLYQMLIKNLKLKTNLIVVLLQILLILPLVLLVLVAVVMAMLQHHLVSLKSWLACHLAILKSLVMSLELANMVRDTSNKQILDIRICVSIL